MRVISDLTCRAQEGSGKKPVCCLDLRMDVRDWSEYFETRRLLGLIPWDRPIRTKPCQYFKFVSFATEVIVRFSHPRPVLIPFSRRICGYPTTARVREYVAANRQACQFDGEVAVLKVASSDSLVSLVRSGVLRERGGVEGYTVREPQSGERYWLDLRRKLQAQIRCGEVIAGFLCSLEKPEVEIVFDGTRLGHVESALERAALQHEACVSRRG